MLHRYINQFLLLYSTLGLNHIILLIIFNFNILVMANNEYAKLDLSLKCNLVRNQISQMILPRSRRKKFYTKFWLRKYVELIYKELDKDPHLLSPYKLQVLYITYYEDWRKFNCKIILIWVLNSIYILWY